MSIKELKSSNYRKGIKWSLNKEHLINTFKAEPYTAATEATLVGSQAITSIELVKDGTTVSLPLIDATKKCERVVRSFADSRTAVYSNTILGSKGIVGIFMGTASVTISSATPINNPIADIEFEGTTHQIASKQKTFNDYPDQRATTETITNWIMANYTSSKNWTIQSDNVDYTKKTFLSVPFIKNLNVANGSDPDKANMSNPSDVRTLWTGGIGLGGISGGNWTAAEYARWYNEYVYDDSTNVGTTPALRYSMWPAAFYEQDPTSLVKTSTTKADQRIKVPNITRNVSITLTKLTDYSYKVDVTVPVKYVYMAASRYNQQNLLAEVKEDQDSLAFLDLITQVTVKLYSYSLVGEKQKIEYSFTPTGELTTVLDDTNILSIPANNLIRTDTDFGGSPWYSAVPFLALTNYKDGRYSAEVEVPGDYALAEGLTVNTPLKLKNIHNDYITKVTGSPQKTYSFISGVHSTVTIGLEYFMSNSLKYFDGKAYLQTKNNDIEVKLRLNVVPGWHAGETYNVALIELDPVGQRLSLYTADGNVLRWFDYSDYASAFFNICFKVKNKYKGTLLFRIMEEVTGIIATSITGLSTNQIIFEIKNIQKMFSKRGFSYNLKLLESKLQEDYYIKVPQSVTALVQGTEYYFRQNLRLVSTIARMDIGANQITYRLRKDDASLEIIEEVEIGGIVINKDQETISLYFWVSGTTTTTFKRFTFAEYIAGGRLITFTLHKPTSGYNLPEVMSNIGGTIKVTTV